MKGERERAEDLLNLQEDNRFPLDFCINLTTSGTSTSKYLVPDVSEIIVEAISSGQETSLARDICSNERQKNHNYRCHI